MLKKALLGACLLIGVSSAAHADFFIPAIDATVDRGLVVEFVLSCQSRMTGKKSIGIMSFSKADKKFCTAKNRCFSTARSAAIESCNSDETILSRLK